MKATISTVTRGLSRVQQKPEFMFVCESEDTNVHFARLSASDTTISSGPNEGKTMAQVTLERLRKATQLPQGAPVAQIISDDNLGKLVGREVTLVLGEYTNPNTQETQIEVQSILFGGISGIDADEFSKELKV